MVCCNDGHMAVDGSRAMKRVDMPARQQTSVAIIGAGFAGLAAAIELKTHGYENIVIFERGADVGGVWRDNTYPGAACDVPSPYYSFSFAPNAAWPSRYSRQGPILDYMRETARKFDLVRHISFNTEVVAADFDEARNIWTVQTAAGDSVEASVLISAVGQLSLPALPAIEGLGDFAGPAFHSAEWDHSVGLAGKKVAVIGTGASAIQFVPKIASQVSRLSLFQRSAPYLLPRFDTVFSEKHHRLLRRVPLMQKAERVAWYGATELVGVAFLYSKPLSNGIKALSRWHMKRGIGNNEILARVWPNHALGCKRVLFANDYLPTLSKPNVDVVTTEIGRIEKTGIRTTDGILHGADVIIYGTGFTASGFLARMVVRGKGGQELREAWGGGARAYLGMSVPHFPNLFLMYGPNTNLGSGSIIFMLENQARYIRQAIGSLNGGALDVRADVEQEYDNELQARLVDGVWSKCSSWYRAANGRVATNWPGTQAEYRRRVKEFDRGKFISVPARKDAP